MELNNLKGFSKTGLIILLSIISICLISIVFGTIDSIVLNSPPNQTATTDTTPDFNFTAISDINTTFSCELFIDDTGYGANDSVSNNTATIITANSTLSDGTYNWYINCTDVNGTSKSEERVITIDTINPVLNFTPPTEPNGTTIGRNWTEANLTIDEPNLNTFKFNWNTTNYTFYDDSLVLGMNLNNNSAIGENSTKAVDISKYGNDGTLENGVSWTSSGRFGSALDFDGTDDYVEVADSDSLDLTELTLEAWIYWNKVGEWQTIFSKGADGDENYELLLGNAEELHSAYIDTGGSRDAHTYTVPGLDSGSWLHLTFIRYYDGTDWIGEVYLNGDLKDSYTYTNGEPAAKTRWLGIGGGDDSRYFNGLIDEARIYNRSLSSEEIKMHYQSEFQKYNSTQYRFYDNVTDLTDGTYTYYGWANDTASNEGQTDNNELRYLNVDTTPPEIQFVTPTTETGNQTETWISANVTASDTHSDTLSLSLYNSTGIYQQNQTSDTQIYINYTGLPDDSYYLNATVNDTAGNTNKTETRTILLDTTPPTISITYPDSNSIVDNHIINGTSSDSNLDYTNISIKQGGTIINSTTNSSSDWEVRLYAQDGVYNITATAYDGAGNSNSTTNTNITIDTPPEIQFVSPTTETGNYSQDWISANVTGSDALNFDTLILSLYNSTGEYQQNTTSDTQIYINYTGLPDDTYYLNATANDTAGNTNQTETRTIEIDTTNPTISITYPDSNSIIDNHIINGTSTDLTLNYTNISIINSTGDIVNSTINSSENWEVNLYAQDGVYNITATAYDGAGNSNTTTNTNITIDTTNPILNFTSPTEPNGTTINRNWTEANITIDELNLDTFKFNWNTTNYTFYDDSLILGMNLNNNSAIGENSTKAVDISKYGNNGTIAKPSDWWNDSFKYRKKLTITNNNDTNLTAGDPINFTIDTASLVSEGKLLANGSDLRIIHVTTEINRTNSTEFNSSDTMIWFNAQAIIENGTSTSDYYVYYGNSEAGIPNTGGITTEQDYNLTVSQGGEDQIRAQWTSGKFGKALSFDGTDDYVDCGNDKSIDIVNPYTLEVWAKPSSFLEYSTIIGKRTDSSATNYALRFENDDTITFYFADGSWQVFSWTYSLSSQWYHLGLTFDVDGNISLYVNGEREESDNTTATPVKSTDPLGIGSYTGDSASEPFNGTIDEVHIYNRALSPEEIKIHYKSEFSKYNSTQYRFYDNVTDLADGTYTYYGWANDTAGNENQTDERDIILDTTNPEISYNPNTDESGNYSKDWIFINVTASDINKDSVKLNWNGTNETFDNQSGDVYWENKTSLADGNYTFYASINDTAGNENQTEEREVKITEWTISVYETDNSSDKSWTINNIPLNFQYYCYAGVDGSCNSSLAYDGDGSTCNFTIENNGSSTVDVLMYALGDYSSSYYICSSSDSTTDGDDSGCQDPPAIGANGADNIQIYNSSAWFNVSSKIHDGDAYGMAIACDLGVSANLSNIDFQVRVPNGVAPSGYSTTLQVVAYSDIAGCSVGSYFVP